MSAASSEAWPGIVEQLYADEQAEREATTSPLCDGCGGTGDVTEWTFRGKSTRRECWECLGTGLQPWARKPKP
jgi:hypothetical protein